MTSALFEATKSGDIEVVKLLLENSADPNLPLNQPILCQGIDCEDLAIARALLEAGANPDVRGHFGSPLETAGLRPNYELAALLIQHKATINDYTKAGRYGSPLAAAAHGGSIEIVRLLIEHGADVNAPLKYGSCGSALAAASSGDGNVRILKYLIEEAGADPSILSTNPPSTDPWPWVGFPGYQDSMWKSGRYLKENGYVVEGDVLERLICG
jgi:ankyrin repeat protein